MEEAGKLQQSGGRRLPHPSRCQPLCLPVGLLPLCIATCNPQVGRYIHAVKGFQLDAFLAPYDLASHNRWRQLAGHISAGVVDALQPVGGGNINVLAEADPALLRPATAAEEVLYAQLAKGRAEAAAAAASGAAGSEAGAAAGEEAAAAEGAEGVDEMQTEQQPTQGAAPAAAADQQQQQQEEGGRWAAAPHAGRCFYTPLPRLVKRGGLTPQELTGGWLGERLGAVGAHATLLAAHSCPVLPCLNSLLQPSTSTSPKGKLLSFLDLPLPCPCPASTACCSPQPRQVQGAGGGAAEALQGA